VCEREKERDRVDAHVRIPHRRLGSGSVRVTPRELHGQKPDLLNNCAPCARHLRTSLLRFSFSSPLASSSQHPRSPSVLRFFPSTLAPLHLVFLSDVFVSPQWDQVEHRALLYGALLKRIIYEKPGRKRKLEASRLVTSQVSPLQVSQVRSMIQDKGSARNVAVT